jgi:dipeptidyl aminopeptidase/acylaminoacyl peptidase
MANASCSGRYVPAYIRHLGSRGRRIKRRTADARPGREQGSPFWSPDGRRIAFDSFTDDYHWHIWTIDADGGHPRRLTTQARDENVPTWSHDGRWIYFSADQGTGRDIWRLPASGGTPERMTRGASGPFACESADGKSLLFQLKDADSPLMAMPLNGGGAGSSWRASGGARLALVLRASITCRAIRAPIRRCMSWFWRPVRTGASERSRNSHSPRWV